MSDQQQNSNKEEENKNKKNEEEEGSGEDKKDNKDEANDEYYAIFNLNKDATVDQIRARYFALSKQYHPDKIRQQGKSDEMIEKATEHFRKINEAYEVLSDPEKRVRYDTFGKAGLNMQIIVYDNTAEGIKNELNRRKRESELKKREMETNATGGVTLKLDAQNLPSLFERKNNQEISKLKKPYANKKPPGYALSHYVSVKNISLKQAFQVPITDKDTLVLQASSMTHSKTTKSSRANFLVQYQRQFSPYTSAEATAIFDQHMVFVVGAKRAISEVSVADFNWIFVPDAKSLGFEASYKRTLSPSTIGEIKWAFPFNNSVLLSFQTINKTSNHSYSIDVGAETSLKYAFSRKFADASNLQLSTKGSLTTDLKPGFEIDSIFFQKINNSNSIGMGFLVGTDGVSFKLGYRRDQQSLSIPITFSDTFSWRSLFATTIIPTILYIIARVLIVKPLVKRNKRIEIEKKRKAFRESCIKKRALAQADQEFMEEAVIKKRDQEESKQGLVIVNALYGNLHSDVIPDPEIPPTFDVTIPLQNLVERSKLQLHGYSKANLDGFYDPCPMEEKQLKIVYLFKEKLHEVEVDDLEAVNIPLEDDLKQGQEL